MGKSQSRSYDLVHPNTSTNSEHFIERERKLQPNNTNGTSETNNRQEEPPSIITMATKSKDIVEVEACSVNDMTNGEMREVEIGEGKALLVKEKEQFYAVGAKCTHYGAPLVKGAFSDGRVRCPWHGACFSVVTGDIEDYPGLDSLPKFDVEVSGGKVVVKASKSALSNHKRQKSMCRAAAANKHKVLIIGGGPAAVACAQTLRQEGFNGQIAIVTKENHLPYDRPKLSKAMDSKAEALALRDADFYKSADIQIHKNKEAVSVDTKTNKVTFKDNDSLDYDSLLLATGGRPRSLPIPGTDLKNVCLLRTPDDANFIFEAAQNSNVVIIGSSFIGMEVAASLANAGTAKSVSVVDIIKVPFQLVLGDKVGSVFQKMHEEKGVKFYFETGISEFVGENGSVKEAVLSDGTRLPADLCVLGVGVVPATEFVKDSGIEMTGKGFIPVDKCMKTSIPNVFAAGDIVEFPLFCVDDEKVNVSHWQMAHAHGRTAAYSILEKPREIKSVPYFWTVMYGKSIRYTGYGPGYDDIVVHGDLDQPKFVAYYTKGEEVVAVASLNFDPVVSQAAQMMSAGKKILKSEIEVDPHGWLARLTEG
ncbi:hypothetical protein ScPMuIL_006974 [Solemya velum]